MKFYRYETRKYSNGSSYDDDSTNRSNLSILTLLYNVKLILVTLTMVKETPKGYWLCYESPVGIKTKDIWVSKTSKKRYAYPTKLEALNNAYHRTNSRIKYLETDLRDAKKILSLVEKEFTNLDDQNNDVHKSVYT